MMSGDRRIDQLTAVSLQPSKGADFVYAHQLAVADNVSGENCRKPALDGVGLHGHSLCALPSATGSLSGRREQLALKRGVSAHDAEISWRAPGPRCCRMTI